MTAGKVWPRECLDQFHIKNSENALPSLVTKYILSDLEGSLFQSLDHIEGWWLMTSWNGEVAELSIHHHSLAPNN